jgi:hypothetical protein
VKRRGILVGIRPIEETGSTFIRDESEEGVWLSEVVGEG